MRGWGLVRSDISSWRPYRCANSSWPSEPSLHFQQGIPNLLDLIRFSSRSIPDSVAGSMPEVRKCKERFKFRSTTAPPERCNVGTFARPRKKDTAAATVPAATPVSQQLSCEQRWIMNGKQLDAPAKRKHNITIQIQTQMQLQMQIQMPIQYRGGMVHPCSSPYDRVEIECIWMLQSNRKNRLFESNPSALAPGHDDFHPAPDGCALKRDWGPGQLRSIYGIYGIYDAKQHPTDLARSPEPLLSLFSWLRNKQNRVLWASGSAWASQDWHENPDCHPLTKRHSLAHVTRTFAGHSYVAIYL